MEDVVVGIDSSTTATKAVAWTAAGKMIAEGRFDIPMQSPVTNYYEQQPRDWWRSTCEALQQLCAKVEPARIQAVAISNQRETMGYFRRDGASVRPSTVWLDNRSRDTFRSLANLIGKDLNGEYLQHKICGKPVDVIPAATRIHWMLVKEPENHRRTEVFSDVHGFLTFKLTGEWQTSWASADPLGLFDLAHKRWSPEILSALSIDESRVPVAQKPGTALGCITAAASAETGLLEGTLVVAGGGDGQLAGLGCGALDPEVAYLNIGTALVSGVYGTTYNNDLRWRTMGGPAGEGYYYETCNRGGTFIVNWFLNTICGAKSAASGDLLEQLELEAANIPIGANGLLMLPYWQGVMTPHWNDAARGAYIGLSGTHSRAHMFRALMEGLAMEQHLCISAAEETLKVPIKTVIAIGGGAKSQVWRQIFSDVMGKTIARADTVEASSLGAGICAAVAAGWFTDFTLASKAMSGRIVEVSEPNPEAHARYLELVAVYEKIYDCIKPLYPGLEQFEKA